MKIAYYPGCSLHSTGIEYDISTKKLCQALGIELVEVKDWICCGSSPAHQCDELMSVALPAKNLALTAGAENLKELCVPCASCYSRLKFAQHRLKDEKMSRDVEQVIGSAVPPDIEVLHILDVIVDKIGLDAVKQKVVRDMAGIKVACYYGCLMTRPPRITGKGQFENPTVMEDLIEVVGAEPVDWNLKTFCCGASMALTQTDVALELTRKILTDAESVEADVVCVGCPLCHANLDGRQQQINKKFNTNFRLPILYFTQLVALAMGIDANELGLAKHITEVDDFLKQRALL